MHQYTRGALNFFKFSEVWGTLMTTCTIVAFVQFVMSVPEILQLCQLYSVLRNYDTHYISVGRDALKLCECRTSGGSNMIKETIGITGATALLLPPLGLSCLACGLPGLLVAGAGLYIVDSLVKDSQGRNVTGRQGSVDEDAGQEVFSSCPKEPG
jgi:hypothetical protein